MIIKRRKLKLLKFFQVLFQNLKHNENQFYKHEINENNQIRIFHVLMSLINDANCQFKYFFFSKNFSHLIIKNN